MTSESSCTAMWRIHAVCMIYVCVYVCVRFSLRMGKMKVKESVRDLQTAVFNRKSTPCGIKFTFTTLFRNC